MNSQGLSYCLNCTDGYFSQNGKCVNCSDAISGCQACYMNGTSLQCAKCAIYGNYEAYGQYFSNGTQCIKCGSDDNTKNCNSCYNYDYKYDGKSDPYCYCNGGYGRINGTCQTCSLFTSNCQSCDNNGGNCNTCNENYYLRLNSSNSSSSLGNCTQCNSPNCSSCSSANDCHSCKSGYFRNYSYYNSTCVLCSDLGSIQKNCASPSCQQSFNNVTNLTSIVQGCSVCESGFGWNSNSGKEQCTNCSEILPNCLSCYIDYFSSSFTCNKCKEGSFLKLENNNTWTCTKNCSDTHATVNYSNNTQNCLPCEIVHGNFCSSCNTTQCLSCNSSYGYLLANLEEKQSCSECKNTDIESLLSLNNKTYCLRKTKTTMENFTIGGNNTIFFNVSCEVNPSRILFVYGPKIYVQNLNNLQNDVLVKVGSKNVTNITSTADTQWVGFGSRNYNSSSVVVKLIPPLKNSGEVYLMNIWCMNLLNKSDISSTTKEWTQPTNGGKTTKISIISNAQLSSSQKKALGYAVKQTLKVNREMYTDEGELVPSKISTSRILATTDNATSYTTTFSILPDYTVSNDDSAAFMNETLKNSSSFLQSVTSILTTLNMASGIQVSSFTLTSDNTTSPDPILSNINLNQNGNSLTINFNLTNSNGTFYAGVEPTIYGLQYSNFSESTLNLNYPIWSLFIQGLNYSSIALTKFVNVTAISATSSSITISNLESNKTYLVYYGAINDNIPPSHTYLYVNVTNTIIASGGSFSIRNYGWSFLGLVIFCLWN